ncbi:hypothetical protein PICMEDRAFT_70649 [Pichia membranifaciens NRRL Y-2026]|uniref:Uncharacterized protein n=1 Tax=Pichia membranifaciens NRRL Y-2026 TaxID=763406 RepID=A0A1E3NU36_9ASCO|nr:hypothetical protein PICMEDRAFT_70649 [Pichia membranifaciens NRRL Y-2026]ODQ49073.1 hypothetical protein PICMEDRAFT_70649 [Pichia membranifaciens NRRL Y-2026]
MEDSETFSKLNSFTFPLASSRGQKHSEGTPRSGEMELGGSGSDSNDELEQLDQPPAFLAEPQHVVPADLSPKSTIHKPSMYFPSSSKRLLTEPPLSSSSSSSPTANSYPSIPYPSRRHSNIILTQKRRNSKRLSISSLSPVTMQDRTFGKTQEYITGSSNINNNSNGDSDKTSETIPLSSPLLKRASSWSMKGPSHHRSPSISSNSISVDSLTTTPLATIDSGLNENNLSYATLNLPPKPLAIENHLEDAEHIFTDSYSGTKAKNDDHNPSLSVEFFDDESTCIMKTPSSGSSYTVGEAEALDLRRPSVVYIVSSPTNLEVDLNVIEN